MKATVILSMTAGFIASVSLMKSNSIILRGGPQEKVDPVQIMIENGIDPSLYKDLGLDQLTPFRVDDPLIE